MDRAKLVEEVASLFPDRGVELLAAAQQPDWGTVLAEADALMASTGLEALTWVRDWWDDQDELSLSLYATDALVTARREVAPDAIPTLLERARLGALHADVGRTDVGDRLVSDAWSAVVEKASPGDIERAAIAAILGQLRVAQGRSSEAVFALREAATVLEPVDAATASECSFRLGQALMAIGSTEEGLRRIQASVRQARSGGPSYELAERLAVLAPLVGERVAPKDAEAVFQESAEVTRQVFGDTSAEYARTQVALSGLLLGLHGRAEEGLGLLDAGVSTLVTAAGPADPDTRKAAALLIERLLELGRAAVARRDKTLLRESLARAESVTRQVFGPGDARISRVRELGTKL